MKSFALVSLALLSGYVSAGIDICPPNYCVPGSQCHYPGPGDQYPHCCSSDNPEGVLGCIEGRWRNTGNCHQGSFCDCTGSHDLICKHKAAFSFPKKVTKG